MQIQNMDELRSSIAHYYRDILGLSDWEERTVRRLARHFDIASLSNIEKYCGPVINKRILDVGCGWGAMLYELAAHSPSLAIGIEPDSERIGIAQKYLKDQPALALQSIGERLPFGSGTFDILICHEVLEHTRDPEQVVLEMVRVLRLGGVAHIMTPNYLSFYEAHYKIVWLPLMPKQIGRWYLRLRGRDSHFINHIQYVNPIFFSRCFKRHGIQYVNIEVQNVAQKIEGKINRFINPARLIALIQMIAFLYVMIMHRDQHFLVLKLEN
jgi:2-polyprenyl-3-methyl-5-hydroxy-6-metoxy-1,4-benzoquinol methylase